LKTPETILIKASLSLCLGSIFACILKTKPEKKEIINISFPGDIVGLHDTGNFKIGDTLTEGEKIKFKGIPSFSPEHFRYVNNNDPMKTKQLEKGIKQLMDEGVAQLFYLKLNNRKIIGTVGLLQFEVIQYRLLHEYGAKCNFENINVFKACWVCTKDSNNTEKEEFKKIKQKILTSFSTTYINNLIFCQTALDSKEIYGSNIYIFFIKTLSFCEQS
jgi:peptide subunit release factor RF-3